MSKRINVPDEDVDRVYRSQRRKWVRVEYSGPKKLICVFCGTLFLSESDGRGRYPQYHTNACKQKAYRERKKEMNK